MNTIKAVVRNGRIETEEPLSLPEGTELLIPLPEDDQEAGWDNSPEGIEAWIEWFDSLPRFTMTPEEEADTQAWLGESNEIATRQMEDRVKDIFP